MTRKRLYHNYLANRSQQNWELYRQQRNICVSLRRKAMKGYFHKHCEKGPAEGKNFWDTLKPFISNKGPSTNCDIILNEDNKIITDQNEITEIFNDFFVNVASNIGEDESSLDLENHPSIREIINNRDQNITFSFSPVEPGEVSKIIRKLNPKKATGTDSIPPKFVKMANEQLTPALTKLINLSIGKEEFPDILKRAEVIPIYKKADKLLKGNYRPVSILPTFSKIFEKVLENQMVPFLNKVLSPNLSAFRRGYSCQDTLLMLTEQWRNDLRQGKIIGALLMDLSKAFDCMPHTLLTAKLKAYGMSDQAVHILNSYLKDRQQRVKIDQKKSKWLPTFKGVPQGSILGPVLFNSFINDIFYFIKTGKLINYADDNTLSVADNSLDHVVDILTEESIIAIKWFSSNLMQANPEKFQAIFLGCKVEDQKINIEGKEITSVPCVKLLGVNLDNKLTFSPHIQELCQKAGRQLNVLQRLSKFLSPKAKIAVFRCFILSLCQYCSIIWHSCGATNRDKLEDIQFRALRYVYDDNTSAYETLLDRAILPTLEQNREKAIATQTFKILNNLAPSYLSNLIVLKNQTRTLRSGQNTLDRPPFKTTKLGLHSFMYIAAVIWNSLPEAIRTLGDLQDFKKELSAVAWKGPFRL